MNKKGYTLIELIASLALLSVVIVFMISILLNLKEQQTSSNIDGTSQILEATISKTINSDVIKKGIINFEQNDNSVRLYFKDNTYKDIIIKDNKLTYKSNTSNTLIKDIPEDYYLEDIKVLNTSYDFHKFNITFKNKKDFNKNIIIEAYSYK